MTCTLDVLRNCGLEIGCLYRLAVFIKPTAMLLLLPSLLAVSPIYSASQSWHLMLQMSPQWSSSKIWSLGLTRCWGRVWCGFKQPMLAKHSLEPFGETTVVSGGSTTSFLLEVCSGRWGLLFYRPLWIVTVNLPSFKINKNWVFVQVIPFNFIAHPFCASFFCVISTYTIARTFGNF